MKIKYTVTEVKYFDVSEERKRIREAFAGKLKQWQRPLRNILNLFLEGKFVECARAYEKLPYNEEDEHPGQEYVCCFIIDALKDMAYYGKKYKPIEPDEPL